MFETGERIAGVNKVAVLRANAIGDLVFALPALDALRAAYPSAEIVLLSTQMHADLLLGRPSPVNRVVLVPPSRGVGRDDRFVDENAAELSHFFDEMRRQRFDLALQLHGGGRYSNPFIKRLGARVTCGLRTRDAEPLDRSLPYVYFQHEVLRLLEVVSLVGACPIGIEPRLAVTLRDIAESVAVVPEGEDPLVTLHPGSTDPRRRWPAEKFAAVGDALARAGGHLVVTGAVSDHALVAQVVRHMAEPGIDACGKLTLGGLVGLLSRSGVVISNDSGPLHLAAAVKVPTVGIFWLLNLMNAAPFTRARHRVFVGRCTHCPICGQSTVSDACEHAVSHVADVGIEEVIEAAMDLLPGLDTSCLQAAVPHHALPDVRHRDSECR